MELPALFVGLKIPCSSGHHTFAGLLGNHSHMNPCLRVCLRWRAHPNKCLGRWKTLCDWAPVSIPQYKAHHNFARLLTSTHAVP